MMKKRLFIKVLSSLALITNPIIAQEKFHLLATMSGDSVGDEFSIVAGVSDVNGDGYYDVLVGAPEGRYAKLYFGGSVFDTLADLTFRDEKINSRFGCSLTGRGDINGDGYPDIVIGASGTWIGPSWPFQCIWGVGAAYVYFGRPSLDTTADLELIVGSWEEQTGWYYGFGYSLDFAGDVSGDGYNDLIVSAPNDDYDAHGRVYIYFGGPEVDDQYDVLLEGENHFDLFGQSVSSLGDVNKDGFDDVIIGAPQSITYSPQEPGKAYLVYGGEEISLANSEVFTGDTTMYNYGRKVSGLGDVNGDSYPDCGIMADDYLRIISGQDRSVLLEVFQGNSWHGNFQYISNGNDINGDNFNDILIGKGEEDLDYTGEVDIFFGGTNLELMPDYMIIGKTPLYRFGSSIDYVGDLNKDGSKEIIIGEQTNEEMNGNAYLYSFGEIDDIKDIADGFPTTFRLYQNYPNPLNPATNIRFSISDLGLVTLRVYDILGKAVATLVDEEKETGEYEVKFNANNLSSGIYFYQLKAGTFIETKKMIYLK